MPQRRRPLPMSVHHNQAPTGQIDDRLLGQFLQDTVPARIPARAGVVIAAHRENRLPGGRQRFEHRRISYVAGVNHKVTCTHPLGDSCVQISVAVGHQTDSHSLHSGHQNRPIPPARDSCSHRSISPCKTLSRNPASPWLSRRGQEKETPCARNSITIGIRFVPLASNSGRKATK